jgi:hypothetical protein
MTEQLISLSTLMLAISLATERFVTLVKSFVPWLAEERKDATGLKDPVQERRRTVAVQIISLLGAYLTTSLVNKGFCLDKDFCFGTPNVCFPAGIIALLSTGGSAFWSHLLGYANAVKDIKRQDRAQQRMDLIKEADTRGIPLNKLPKI